MVGNTRRGTTLAESLDALEKSDLGQLDACSFAPKSTPLVTRARSASTVAPASVLAVTAARGAEQLAKVQRWCRWHIEGGGFGLRER
jgi:hypothetical protein